MCGRYALGLRPSQVRAYLQNEHMPAYEAPPDEGDEAPRQSYNFAPGYNGIVYRADVPDWGAGPRKHKDGESEQAQDEEDGTTEDEGGKETRYKLQSMRWGLIPFWTRRSPDYSSMMKTINCRADSLSTSTGMWNTIKPRKRCIVVCQGFYEWYKNPHNPKDKTPHFVKRKDGQLMCMAGLWDCVKYDGSAEDEKIYSYTIITTDTNKQLNFLHDRMPVILNNGSEELRTWLDPKRHDWNAELQGLLKPFQGELEVYPVSQEVGKVGNNSERYIVPVDSTENKANIANFFSNAKSSPKKGAAKKSEPAVPMKEDKTIKMEPDETRATIEHDGTEDNAPLPVPASHGVKREHEDVDDVLDEDKPAAKMTKIEESPEKEPKPKAQSTRTTRSRDPRTNGTASNSPVKKEGKDTGGSQKITNFFSK